MENLKSWCAQNENNYESKYTFASFDPTIVATFNERNSALIDVGHDIIDDRALKVMPLRYMPIF